MTALPTTRAAQLTAQAQGRAWLIEGLWSAEAVGIIGGQPKCYKSFLALDLALAVASGAPCLRSFPTAQRGPVLLYAAEDALHIVRERLAGIAHAAGVDFDTLQVHVITVPTLRLDHTEDRKALQMTVEQLSPRLLVLDPFVRLHSIDENVASEVAPLLAFLRTLQRRFHTAVALVHHARKGAAHARGGQALRGSSELHAWGDSNLYLRRTGEQLHLSIEHRAAASSDRIALTLHASAPALALQRCESVSPEKCEPAPSAVERIEQILATATAPLSQRELRLSARMRMSDVAASLSTLLARGRVIRSAQGYQHIPA